MTKGTALIRNEVYHADPAYSSSDLKLITNTCPDAFYKTKYEGQKKDHAPALKKAFRDGELCHAFTLEPERAKKIMQFVLIDLRQKGKNKQLR